jgi:hypothetical protein
MPLAATNPKMLTEVKNRNEGMKNGVSFSCAHINCLLFCE